MRLLLSVFLVLCLSCAVPAVAETVQDRVVRELADQGFTTVSAKRTLLGNLRIIALAQGLRREIVINPRTGEVLRDFVQQVADSGSREERNTGRASSGTSRVSATSADDGGYDDTPDTSEDNDDDGQDDDSDDGDDDSDDRDDDEKDDEKDDEDDDSGDDDEEDDDD